MYKGLAPNTAAVQMKYLHYTVPINGAFAYGVDGNYRNHRPVVSPNNVLKDEIFFSALMHNAIVAVQIGNNPAVSYPGLQAINHWSHPFNGSTGTPVLVCIKNVFLVGDATRPPITANTTLSNGCTNYNAWVGFSRCWAHSSLNV
jgi:hypothetical protein